ncbi:MAG: ABC transporter ATP-binding protein [Micromonosporaceae bacterium]
MTNRADAPAGLPSTSAGSRDKHAAGVRLAGVSKQYPGVAAVAGVDLEVAPGQFFTLLGPSGSGKTTLLRIIAGFERPDAGRVLLGDDDVTHLPPYRRDVNTVFQDYALFPHMNVAENVGYGLAVRRVPRAERRRKVEQALAMVRLAEAGYRRPAQLSGGQRQRVALARAIVNEPALLLLDEPLGALDLKLRQEMQVFLKHIQREVGITFLYVTHDQEEALTMSDRIAVINAGQVEQVGTPVDVYERPRTEFVAGFIGVSNVVDDQGTRWTIRPEKISMTSESVAAQAGSASRAGRVRDVVYVGMITRYVVDLDGGGELVVVRQNTGDPSAPPVTQGERVRLSWKRDQAYRIQPGAIEPKAPNRQSEPEGSE